MLWLGLEGRKKLKELQDELQMTKDALEHYHRGFKQLEMEWTDTLDRLNHAMGRITARQRRGAKQDTTVEYDDGVDPISREIIEFRNGRR